MTRGQHYDIGSRSATRLAGQNVRGLTQLKLSKVVQFMGDRKISISCLQETWQVTPDGTEILEMDGFLIIHHGEKTKSCKRGRNGVTIILDSKARAAFESGGSKFRHSENGRVLTLDIPVEGSKTLKVTSAYAPCSNRHSAERQAFYDDVAVQTQNSNAQDMNAVFIDGNASMGVGVHAKDRPLDAHASLGPYGERHVNAAGQELREFLQVNSLASAMTFFLTKGRHYSTWNHPRTHQEYQLDHFLINRLKLGRVKQVYVCPEIMVESDHFPILVELMVGRMQRRQAAKKTVKPVNFDALKNPELKQEYGDKVGNAMTGWTERHTEATLEEKAKAWREIPMQVAMEVCGKREKKSKGWFTAHKTLLMELVAKRNQMEREWRRHKESTAKAAAKIQLKKMRKELKKAARGAKTDFFAEQVAKATGGEKTYWECVAALRGSDAKAQRVALQNFLNNDGVQCKTPEENAAAATEHFTKVYNNSRERPEESAAAVDGVEQRKVKIELDDPITFEEFNKVLNDAKKDKATSNQVPIEVLEATRTNVAAVGLLYSYTSEVFEEGRAADPPVPPPPPEPPPPPQPPPPQPPNSATQRKQEQTKRRELIAGAKAHGWRCQWQQENPKGRASKDRYALYCGAKTHAEAIRLGAKPEDLANDLRMGYLQIFQGSLRVDENATAGGVEAEVEEEETITALLTEYARMRLKILPKKGDLRDLNNWRGIMLLDAASKIISMIINNRLQRLLKEIGIEEQNGFSGGRGCSDGSFCIRQALKKRREHGQESWVLFVDLVKAFDSVPRDILFSVLAKFGVPPHLIRVIKRMNTDLQVTFDLNGEPVAVPCTVGVKQGCPLSPTLFLFVMQACLESLEKAMSEESKLKFRTNTRMEGKNGGKVSGTDWTNQGEFSFTFWASLYADDAACPLDSRATLLAATNAIYRHLRLFGLLMHVGSAGKKSKTEAMYCPARDTPYEDGDTSDLVLDCGGTVSFTKSFVYLGSLLHCDLSDDHDVDARIKKASKAFGALRDCFFSSSIVTERLKGKVYAGGVLAVLLYGCESWCLTAASLSKLCLWHNKRLREMCRVTMCQTMVHRITSKSLQQRTGVFDLQHYVASRTLLWAGHVARMPKSRLPKRLMLSWVQEPRLSGGQEMNFGRSLSRHLQHFGLPLTFTEWAAIAQDRAKWHQLATKPPFAIGKPFLRQPRGDTRATPEDQRLAIARRAAEIKERRAIFAANADANADTPTNNP